MAKKKHRKTKGGPRSQAPGQSSIALVTPSPSPAATMRAGEVDGEVAKAIALMVSGDLERAGDLLERALEVEPSHRLALESLGRLHMTRQNFDEAVKIHNRLVVLYAPDPRVHNALGVSLLMAGQLDGALIHLTRSMELEPGNVRFIANLAKAFMMKGEWAPAQELLEKAFVLSEGKQMESILEALDYCAERTRADLQAGAA